MKDDIKRYDWSSGDIIWADKEGNIIFDDGINTWNPIRAKEFLDKVEKEKEKKNG